MTTVHCILSTIALLVAWGVKSWLFPSKLYRVPMHWRWMSWYFDISDGDVPMWKALQQRRVIAALLFEGHAEAAHKAMIEVDAICASVCGLQRALCEIGFPNKRYSPESKNLQDDVTHALRRLADIEARLREVSRVGVQATAEKMLLDLLVRRQDSEESRDSLLAAAVEINPPKPVPPKPGRRKKESLT